MKSYSKAVPCAHIADYYDFQQLQHQCIGNNMLRHGYREWADGKHKKLPGNNLYGRPKRANPPKSVKQILVRDFNWRMGNLRRLEMSASALTGSERTVVECAVRVEMKKQSNLHRVRLHALEIGAEDFIAKSQTIQSAMARLEYEQGQAARKNWLDGS